MTEVTRLLEQIDRGEPNVAERLLPLVYDELRKLAAAKIGPGAAGADAASDGAWCTN